jgi:hypothetical protein
MDGCETELEEKNFLEKRQRILKTLGIGREKKHILSYIPILSIHTIHYKYS